MRTGLGIVIAAFIVMGAVYAANPWAAKSGWLELAAFVEVPNVNWVIAARTCGPELAASVSIPDSDWVIRDEVFRCSVMDSGREIIFARNTRTQERVDLVLLGEQTDSKITVAGDKIVIALPNLVDITSKIDRFNSYDISFRFLPRDDPATRRNYQYWIHHPMDPSASEWANNYFSTDLYIRPGKDE